MSGTIILLAGFLLMAISGTCQAAQQITVGLRDVIATVETAFKADRTGQLPISDFTADFFQRTQLAREGRELRGDGQILVKLATANSPLMYRFEYFRPYQQEIVSDGTTLWIYHPENREVIQSDVSFLYNRPGFNPDRDRAVNFLQGIGRISKDFQINFAAGMNDAAGNYILELNPRHAMLSIRRILLVVNRDSVLSQVTGTNSPPGPPAVQQAPSRALPLPARPTLGTSAQFGPLPPVGGRSSEVFPILATTQEDQEGNSTTMEFSNIRINNRLMDSSFSFLIPPGAQVVRPSELNQPR